MTGKRPSALWTGVAALLLAGGWATVNATEDVDRVVELAPGVFAALQRPTERFDDANSLIIVGESEVVVVDPPSAPQAVADLVESVRRKTDLPVRIVINTHWHGDHTEGNAAIVQAFGRDVILLGHESLSVEVPERAATAHAERRERYEELLPQARQQLVDGLRTDGSPLSEEDRAAVEGGIAYVEAWLAERASARFLSPTVGYGERVVLHRGSRRIELHRLKGHTRGDTVVFLPAEGILASGDLLDELPYVGHGYPRAWITSLERLADLEFSTVVPGHGPIFETREPLERALGFLRDLVHGVEAAQAEGMTVEEAVESIDLSAWRRAMASDGVAERFFDAVRGEAIGRTWADLAGELED